MPLSSRMWRAVFTLLAFAATAALQAQDDHTAGHNTVAAGAEGDFTARSAPDIALFPFFHGVASGDPLEDAVVIWTRLTSDDGGMLPVNWRMATDTAMANVVASGTAMTSASRDYTVKVDVTGLQANRWYYYEFEYLGRRSLIGRTRTAPAAGAAVDSLRFALMSCSNYMAGYFNAYAHLAQRNDIDAVLHVGDYIYEYETGGYGFAGLAGRDHDPDNEIITLSDYRLRHSWYKLDDDLRAVHQQFPFVVVYDDHEFANDAWKNGAENHNAGEGPWTARRSAAFQAWLEWMPVRDPSVALPNSIFRKLPFGGLIDFFVVDTRVEGRDEQDFGMASDPNHSILGPVQFAWLAKGLKESSATWKVMVNQVMFAPLEVLGSPINSDAWDGYAAERGKLFDTLNTYGVDNFVVLTGDIHTAWSNNIPSPYGTIGAEFTTTSVTSPGIDLPGGEGFIQLFNPHVRYVNLTEHGYALLDFNSSRVQADHWFVNTISSVNPSAYPASSWKMDAGTVGLTSVGSASTRPGPGPARPPLAPVNSCGIPANPSTTGITSNAATMSWDGSPSAVGYLLQGQRVGFPGTKNVKLNTNSRTFNIFKPARSYQWRVAATCDSVNLSPYTAWQGFTTDSAGMRLAAPVLHEPRFLGVYPVPFVDRVGVHFALTGESPVQARMIDVNGRVVAQEDFGTLPAGAFFREWTAGQLASGTYVLQLCSGGLCAERTVVKQ